eukprot:CAMPEP_0197030484 /NCGR_PEP_ID=MMETSP1384-20130603/9714_1 /TAXON_ID=29189 /ORGANISM="Ammonia sp." /LENGTH=441 /DNA_ID=CAMNT_0042459847 /DNA_START=95 /DNA_END=1420 /DNA_ORIENTATION=+
MSSFPEGSDDVTENNNTSDLPPYNATADQMQQSMELGQAEELKHVDVEPEEEVVQVMVQQPQPQPEQAQIVMVVPPQQQQQQVMMSTQQQVLQPPQEPQGFTVAAPDASSTVPVSENPYLKSNNVVTDKRKEFMMPVDVGYYRVKPEFDKLDEMKPWESDGQMYSFACCTEYFEGVTQVDAQEDKRKQSVGTATAEASWAHTVYHKTNTEMLTVLKKEMVSTQATFDFTTKNSNKCMWCCVCLFFVVGLILIAAGGAISSSYAAEQAENVDSYYDSDSDDGSGAGSLIGPGVALWVIAILIVVVVKCQQKKASGSSLSSSQELEITTTSIPIYCVRSVKRKATLTHSKSSASVRASGCDCCAAVIPAAENNEQKDDLCVVTIYHRSVDGSGVDGAIEVKLSAHQGFNFQRYLNCVIDGCHPKWRENYGDRNQYSLELKKER